MLADSQRKLRGWHAELAGVFPSLSYSQYLMVDDLEKDCILLV